MQSLNMLRRSFFTALFFILLLLLISFSFAEEKATSPAQVQKGQWAQYLAISTSVNANLLTAKVVAIEKMNGQKYFWWETIKKLYNYNSSLFSVEAHKDKGPTDHTFQLSYPYTEELSMGDSLKLCYLTPLNDLKKIRHIDPSTNAYKYLGKEFIDNEIFANSHVSYRNKIIEYIISNKPGKLKSTKLKVLNTEYSCEYFSFKDKANNIKAELWYSASVPFGGLVLAKISPYRANTSILNIEEKIMPATTFVLLGHGNDPKEISTISQEKIELLIKKYR
ncbi:hypothetical protein ACFL5G_04350 [Candidatus Margulisiibacteriota bacterium]